MAAFDASEVRALAEDFGRAAGRAVPLVDRVVKRAAQNVKNAMVSEAESSGHYKHFSRSISYDRSARVGVIGYEVGPRKSGPQGALGNLLYFGSVNNGPVLDIEVGLRDEAPRLVDNLAQLAERLASGRG